MKTVKEIADLCECSKTTVQRTIKELNIQTVQNKNRLLISDTDTERIYRYIVGNVAKVADNAPNETTETENATEQGKTATEQSKTETNVNNQNTKSKQADFSETADFFKVYSEMIEILKEQLKEKDKQLETKDRQIESLQEQNKMLIQSNAFTLKQLEDKSKTERQEQNPTETGDIKESAEMPPETAKKKKSIFSWWNK